MMISPDTFYEMNLKGKTTAEIMTVIRNLEEEIDNLENMLGAASHDKKRSGNKISIVLVKEMGESYYEKVDVSLLSEIAKG